jgi:transcriptional regulator with XRE-family HTH domain
MDEKHCHQVLSTNIKRYRGRLGMSQLKLALELDISPNFLSDVETGKKWMAFPTLVRMAGILRIEPYELLKPEEAIGDETYALLTKCLDDLAASLRQRVEQAVTQSVDESIANIRDHYLP